MIYCYKVLAQDDRSAHLRKSASKKLRKMLSPKTLSADLRPLRLPNIETADSGSILLGNAPHQKRQKMAIANI